MGGSPIVLAESSQMVSSPLHLTASLAERLMKANTSSPQHDGQTLKTNILHDECPLGGFLEMEPPMSHGSSDDIAVHSLLRRTERAHEKKHVAFGDITTRSFTLILGDHPCCSMGCPLALGWEYSQNPSLSLDEYEATRSPRKTRENLRTTWGERRSMLENVTDREVQHQDRILHRERSCQRQRNRKACAAFFDQTDCFNQTEDCKTAAASVAPPQQQQQAQCT